GFLVVSGCCEKEKEPYYNEQGALTRFSDKCLKEIICQVPDINVTETINFELAAHESCYDLINDPDDLRGEVDRMMKEHPDNWSKYITPHKLDPTIRMITNNNLTEITCENVYIDRSELK
ncbi:MAG: hypothetical protein IIB83_04155, partial [Bacteroidetes bacterium]|nr:hypothetical protein [Bacteroidota bacterium]